MDIFGDLAAGELPPVAIAPPKLMFHLFGIWGARTIGGHTMTYQCHPMSLFPLTVLFRQIPGCRNHLFFHFALLFIRHWSCNLHMSSFRKHRSGQASTTNHSTFDLVSTINNSYSPPFTTILHHSTSCSPSKSQAQFQWFSTSPLCSEWGPMRPKLPLDCTWVVACPGAGVQKWFVYPEPPKKHMVCPFRVAIYDCYITCVYDIWYMYIYIHTYLYTDIHDLFTWTIADT